MAYIPSDPIMLFSWVNTKLRDEYSSLEALCDDLDISPCDISEKLEAAGYTYNPDLNKFM
ncbi:MAG: DUF4250 domain-containing protein [Bacteroidales bacterium]|nr:DUF4250 domain-containing protein [Candidatus Cryptobacteroides caccocaballi]